MAVDFQRMTWGLGYVPEQVWEDPDTPASPYGADPTTASIGFRNGKAAGSATPLIWGQAQYLRLVLDLKAGTLHRPAPDHPRAVPGSAGPPANVPVTIASPANGATVTGAHTIVTGTTTPGARVDVAAGHPGSRANTSSVVATVADSHGAYSATIPTRTAHGKTIITAAATAGAHATGWAQESLKGRK